MPKAKPTKYFDPAKRPGLRRAGLERTRRIILQAALDRFSTEGFEGASTRAIAAQAGVNHGLIRHHFGSKEKLWRAAVEFLFERLEREMRFTAEDVAGRSAREIFEMGLRRYVHYCARHPEHARIMVQESIGSGPRLKWMAQNFIKRSMQAVRPVIEAAKARGDLPNLDTVSIQYIIAPACQMIFALASEVKAVTGRDMTTSAAIEAHADTVVALFAGKRRA
jgi:TetR/AcrR family transcriptional regulator